LIEASTRNADRLFRFGGEEFVLLLPGVDRNGLYRVAENLRQKIEAQLRSPAGPVTASLGVALLRADEDRKEWLQRVDAALYRAKHAGRNQTAVADMDAPIMDVGDSSW
jgi:diguanylate cyclase (GGDEF)-like protein